VIKVAVTMPPSVGDAGELIADVRALEAAGAHAVWLHASGVEQVLVLGAIASLTQRIQLGVTGGALPHEALAALQKVSGGRALAGEPSGEGWTRMSMPPDRESWSSALQRHEQDGFIGVIVPWDPRLIDLLRNPGDEDRSDLLMSTG
jgi:alkanesulfonate monooxygenase SsuD/methylene tetrahydromethanopterin reductase-like flavin-dependent oxidoreductase (luciferase family)